MGHLSHSPHNPKFVIFGEVKTVEACRRDTAKLALIIKDKKPNTTIFEEIMVSKLDQAIF
jgi:hypothetical protein